MGERLRKKFLFLISKTKSFQSFHANSKSEMEKLKVLTEGVLRLEVVLELVAVVVLTGVDGLATELFSGSESVFWPSTQARLFLLNGAINLSISFLFSANIFDRSEKNLFS